MSDPTHYPIFGRIGRRSKQSAAKIGELISQDIGSDLILHKVAEQVGDQPASSKDIVRTMDAITHDIQLLYDSVFDSAFELDKKIDNTVQSSSHLSDMINSPSANTSNMYQIDYSSARDVLPCCSNLEYSPTSGVRLASVNISGILYDATPISYNVVLPGNTISRKVLNHIDTKLSSSIPWTVIGTSSADSEATLVVVFDLGKPSNISKLCIARTLTSDFDHTVVDLEVSEDNDSYTKIASGNCNPDIELTFVANNVRYARVTFTKLWADGADIQRDGFLYRWMIRYIVFSWAEHYDTGVITSRPIDVKRSFSEITVDIDSFVPDGCTIQAELATGRYGNVGNWIPIVIGKKTELDTTSFTSIHAGISVRDSSTGIAMLSTILLSDAEPDTITVFRNVGVMGENRHTPDGNPIGWRNIPPYYSCIVITDSDTSIDVGGNTIIVDGVEQSGNIFLEKGAHSVMIHESAWNMLTPDATSKQDRLYPYNPRYVIEGHPTILHYKGIGMFVGGAMKRCTFFQLKMHHKNVDDYTYAVNGSRIWIPYLRSTASHDSDTTTQETFMVRYLRDISPTPNTFALRVNMYSPDSPLTPVLYKARLHFGG